MAGNFDERLSRLLGALYGGLLAPQPWEDFLRALSEWLSAAYATLMLTAPGLETPGSMVSPDADPHVFEDYVAGFFATDPFQRLPDGKVVSLAEFFRASDSAEVREYRAFLDAIGADRVLGIDLHFPSGLEARWRVTRTRPQRDFSARDRAMLQTLVPHLRNAVQLFERLQLAGAEHGVYRSAVEQLGVAALILDSDGRVVRSNAIADRLLDLRDGVGRDAAGRLAFGDRAHQRSLRDMLERPPSDPWRFKVEGRTSGDLSGVARAVTIPAMMRGGAALAIFLTPAQEASPLDPAAARQLFGLTPTEARLAAELASGSSLVDAAALLGMSHNTARAHLRSIFSKTGARRQAQLVHLLRGGLP